MIDDKPTAPLSPPNSPRMSDAPTKPLEYQWQVPATTTLHPAVNSLPPPQAASESEQFSEPNRTTVDTFRPPLRSHKSFPYSLGPSSRLQQDVSQDAKSMSSGGEYGERLLVQGPQPTGSSDLQPATFGGSAPTSPVGRLTPRSTDAVPGGEQVEDDELDLDMGDQEEDEDKPPMTAAELRAHKRKMKRFRLTHNQTRFLMSEFARQAHPDAAHRERLSREIPGLSPRQVQVWFQNRRAKLKRLTTDDRERMMRSRALPADFDMTQALHSPFGAGPPNMGTPMPSPGAYSHFGDVNGVRPLTLDTLRRVPEYEHYGQQYASPTGISSAIGGFAFTPPQSATTDAMSPGSAASDMSAFGIHSRTTQESPRRHPFGLQLGSQSGFGVHQPQMPRLFIHDRLSRPVGESASSPLRTSMSYSGMGSSSMPLSQQPERAASFSEQPSYLQDRAAAQRSLVNPAPVGAGPYGLGFSYGNSTTYQNTDQQQLHQQQDTTPTSSAPHVGLPQYRRDSSHLAGPPITTYSQYQPSAFVAAQLPHYTAYQAPYSASQTFSNPFQSQATQNHQQQQHSHQSFTPVPSQPQQFGQLGNSNEAEHRDDRDNSDGSVPLHPQY